MNEVDEVPDVNQDDDGPESNLCSEDACAEYRLELEDRIKEVDAEHGVLRATVECLTKEHDWVREKWGVPLDAPLTKMQGEMHVQYMRATADRDLAYRTVDDLRAEVDQATKILLLFPGSTLVKQAEVRMNERESLETKYAEAIARAKQAEAEVERRFDCHPADGVSRCGACVTCLTKDLDEANLHDARSIVLLRRVRPHLQQAARDAAATKSGYDRETYERRMALMALLTDIHFAIDEGSLGTNQPCVVCGAEDGTYSERGFPRCSACGFPGQ